MHTTTNFGQESCEKRQTRPTVKINDKENCEILVKIHVKNAKKNEEKCITIL
jgi:hypothetical protein